MSTWYTYPEQRQNETMYDYWKNYSDHICVVCLLTPIATYHRAWVILRPTTIYGVWILHNSYCPGIGPASSEHTLEFIKSFDITHYSYTYNGEVMYSLEDYPLFGIN